jgi:hypothetical protein
MSQYIQIAIRTVYALMGAGLHGLSGLNPRASIHMINCCHPESSMRAGCDPNFCQ